MKLELWHLWNVIFNLQWFFFFDMHSTKALLELEKKKVRAIYTPSGMAQIKSFCSVLWAADGFSRPSRPTPITPRKPLHVWKTQKALKKVQKSLPKVQCRSIHILLCSSYKRQNLTTRQKWKK